MTASKIPVQVQVSSRRRSLVRVFQILVLLLVLLVHPATCAKKDDEASEEADLQKQKAAAARRKQRRDARIVQKVLHAASQDDHYAVLGLRYKEIQVPPKTLRIANNSKYQVTLPGLRLFHTSTDQIKRAYRTRAVLVHPDKNRHPQANAAFVAVENSLQVLTDPQRRGEYDRALRLAIQKRRQETVRRVSETLALVLGTLQKALGTLKVVLGPFAFPVLILGALII
jgi:DnaJ domain